MMITDLSMPSTTTDARWRALVSRDLTADGAFVYGVASTGVYCRPSCPSRRPRPAGVTYFPGPAEAERAGYRACRRCRPQDAASPLVTKVERVRRWVDEHPGATPSLKRLARLAGTSPWHLQRSFTRLFGVSPREYAAARRVGKLKRELRSATRLAEVGYEAGYGSPSRLYDESKGALGMTPGAYRNGGADQEIRYGIAKTTVGFVLVARTARGVCRVSIGDQPEALESGLTREFPRAAVTRDDRALAGEVSAVTSILASDHPQLSIPLDVLATAFQRRVWNALQRIPRGQTRTYAEVAASIGAPRAARAVARACATNPVALVIPCHRVVPAAGGTGGYRWGRERKERILEGERPSASVSEPTLARATRTRPIV
jgi:AraC family transcriptional regulator, regulatory protein of adaptative response / methylated-DNA-[protein]-cysteine methyltransferase